MGLGDWEIRWENRLGCIHLVHLIASVGPVQVTLACCSGQCVPGYRDSCARPYRTVLHIVDVAYNHPGKKASATATASEPLYYHPPLICDGTDLLVGVVAILACNNLRSVMPHKIEIQQEWTS